MFLFLLIDLIKKRHRAILIILWGLVQLAMLLKFGVRSAVDTSRYRLIAGQIIAGEFPSGSDVWYVGYAVTIALAKVLAIDIKWIAIWNLIASFFALISIYKISLILNKDWKSGFIASLFYLLFVKISQWNYILYTDPLFTSFCVITIWLFFEFRERKTKVYFALFSLLMLYTIFLRPVGLVYFGCFTIALIYPSLGKRNIAYLGILVIGFLLGLNWVLIDFVDSFLGAYARSEIIYPGLSLGIEPPKNLLIPDPDHFPIVKIIVFVFQNPVHFLKLFSIKILLFVLGVRPYFAPIHNILLVLFLMPCYCLALYGFSILKSNFLKWFIPLFVGIQIIMVGLTTVNWDGRFLLPTLPFIFILTSLGFIKLLQNRIAKR